MLVFLLANGLDKLDTGMPFVIFLVERRNGFLIIPFGYARQQGALGLTKLKEKPNRNISP